MLTKTKMQEIQDLKLQGYTKADIIRYYEAQGRKPPSRPTLSKYYDMDVIPDDPGAKLAKPKTFDVEPFRSTIVRILEANSGKSFCMSSVYDVLEEKFIENGDYEKLPGNQQTLRNYIVSAKYSCGFPDSQVSFIIVVDRYLDYFTTIMED